MLAFIVAFVIVTKYLWQEVDIIMEHIMENRAFILIFDMLAGHWDEEVIVPATGLQPPNVFGYVKSGLLPTFRECMDKGVFVYAWNMGTCNTPYGQKYLATGSYKTRSVPGEGPFWIMVEGVERRTILTACKMKYPNKKVAAFGSAAWMQTGWWKAQDCTMGWGSYFSDFLTMQYCFKWMLENPDWKIVLLYLAQFDLTGNCPVFQAGAPYTKDKHHSLLELDKYLWMVKKFLTEHGWWPETFLFIGSDHGCHVGCNVAVKEAIEKGLPPEQLTNYCSNHQPPFDCYLWDFAGHTPTQKRIDCCRRITFLFTGGALPAEYHGKVIPRAEIIDFASTIAKLMEIDLGGDGNSVL